jgi:D-alanyl-D-alanine endopeptidase (penicillin-binding protein 7)
MSAFFASAPWLTGLTRTIGWALLDFVWQGFLLGGLCALLMWLLRHARPQLRYALAGAGLLLCLLLPLLNVATALLADGGEGLNQSLSGRARSGLSPATLWPTWQVWQMWQGWEGLQAHLPALVGLWLGCVLLLAGRMLLGLIWLSGYERHGQSDPHWQQRLDELAERLGIARKVLLRVVHDGLAHDGPITFGSLRPLVLVPASLLSGLPAPLLEALLAHELAHVRRFDYSLNLLQGVIETVLFFHPVVWWLSKRIRIEREHIADDLAASVLGDARRLALALSGLEQFRSRSPELAIAANGGYLMLRIKRLLRPETRPLNWQAALAVTGIACASLTLCAQALATGEASARVDGKTVAAKVDMAACPKLLYPAESAKKQEQGTTVLRLLVDKNSTIVKTELEKSSGFAMLDESAVKQLGSCKVQAASKNGKPLQSWVKIAYEWKLE